MGGMSPHESRLLRDGGVFPPVTPDPPPPPGQEEIVVPDVVIRSEEKAKEKGAFRLYWQTQEYNGAARSLYDTITPRSSFIVYRKNL